MIAPTLPRDRCEFSAIVDRPPLKLPENARLVFWTIVNYEVWDIARPMPRQVLPAPTGVSLLPDVPHWSWHEYGMRVGAWRFFELYERLGITPTLAINARTCEDYGRVAAEAKRLNWEFMGHGYDQIPIHKIDDQAGMITRSLDIFDRQRLSVGVGELLLAPLPQDPELEQFLRSRLYVPVVPAALPQVMDFADGGDPTPEEQWEYFYLFGAALRVEEKAL